MDYFRRRWRRWRNPGDSRSGPQVTAPPPTSLSSSTPAWCENVESIHMPQAQNMVNAPVGGTVVNVVTVHSDGQNHGQNTPTTVNNIVQQENLQTARAAHEIYPSQLLTQKRGFPLWVPGPGMQLPIAYRREGISIGDIGVLTSTGEFDFLFNIFQPANHPINRGVVPRGFSPLSPDELEFDIQKTVVYGPDTYLASSSVRKTENWISEPPIDHRFESTAKEAAILIMPDGATTQNLLDTRQLRSTISSNATEWYTYVRDTRGRRDVKNGDIRVVVGIDKVSSWGIATSACSTGQTASYVFKHDPTHSYKWDCIGGSGRVGPQKREIHDLVEGNTVPENQCVFVRTINFTLSGEMWTDFPSGSVQQLGDPGPWSGNSRSQDPPSGHRGGAKGEHGSSGSGMPSSGHHPGSISWSSHSNETVKFGTVEPGVDHPSAALHNFLHEKFPDANMVITEDMEWISVLEDGVVVFPEPVDLFERIMKAHEVKNHRGIIQLDRKDGPELRPSSNMNPVQNEHMDITEGARNAGVPSTTNEVGKSQEIISGLRVQDRILPQSATNKKCMNVREGATNARVPSTTNRVGRSKGKKSEGLRILPQSAMNDKVDLQEKRHNIIVFGEAGCGKSSIVNMIVGDTVAKVSTGAGDCTFQNEWYEADIDGTAFRIFDTAGLNEGDEGRVPHWKAVQALYTLIRQLDCVSLLIFCIRGRIKANTRSNWTLFNNVICGGTVPTLVVVTGLEGEANLDDWWMRAENKDIFRRYKMKPKGVSCVVSVRGHQNQYVVQYRESQEKLRTLILNSYRRKPWSKEKEVWFSHIYNDIHRAGICFYARSDKEFTAVMMNVFAEFVEEVNMDEEDSEKLKRSLLQAEKKIEKGRKTRRKTPKRMVLP